MKFEGVLHPIDGVKIQGWVSAERGEDARLIDVYFDDRLVRTLLAKADDRNWLTRLWSKPVSRFELQIAPQTLQRLPAEVKVRVKDQKTGIELKGSPGVLFGDKAVAIGTELKSEKGEFFVINKNGVLVVQYGNRSPEHRRLSVENAVAMIEFFEKFGFRACLAYGGLLGAVRSGRLLDHDDDVDIMFVAKSRNLEGAVAEFNAALNQAQAAKLKVKGFSLGQAHIFMAKNNFKSPIDIFLGWVDDRNNVFLNFALAGSISADKVFPLRATELEGVSIKAPADPAAFCEALYGPGWRVPDPFFHWSDQLDARTRTLFELIAAPIDRQSFWNRRYVQMKFKADARPDPASMQDDLTTEKSAILIGCGLGEAAVNIAKARRSVLTFEYATRSAIETRTQAAKARLPRCRVRVIDIRDLRKHAAFQKQARRLPGPKAIFATIALDDYRMEDVTAFASFCRGCLERDDKMILRITGEVPGLWRQPKLRVDDILAKLEGFELLSRPPAPSMTERFIRTQNAPSKFVFRRSRA